MPTEPNQPKVSNFAWLIMLMIFAASATGGIKIGLIAADAIILRIVYGADRVAREHLTIVKTKPELVVSNGDVLHSHGFVHFIITAVLFMSLGATAIIVSSQMLPRPMRDALNRSHQRPRGQEEGPGCLAIAIGAPLAIVLFTTQSLWPNAIAYAAAIVLAWIAFKFKPDASTSPQP